MKEIFVIYLIQSLGKKGFQDLQFLNADSPENLLWSRIRIYLLMLNFLHVVEIIFSWFFWFFKTSKSLLFAKVFACLWYSSIKFWKLYHSLSLSLSLSIYLSLFLFQSLSLQLRTYTVIPKISINCKFIYVYVYVNFLWINNIIFSISLSLSLSPTLFLSPFLDDLFKNNVLYYILTKTLGPSRLQHGAASSGLFISEKK